MEEKKYCECKDRSVVFSGTLTQEEMDTLACVHCGLPIKPMPNKLRILLSQYIKDYQLNQAIKDIRALVQKKKNLRRIGIWDKDYTDGVKEGYNQCRADTLKNFGGDEKERKEAL